MAEPASHDEVRARLHELASELREAEHLEPEAQAALADLVDELSKALAPSFSHTAETAHLARSAAQLAQALHQEHNPSLLTAAKQKFQTAAVRAEAEAPLATGIARRILDALADFGI